ncbi:hypothetical protein SAMD00019534_086100 [Acytostelium subglobosum LB1]|uniref:hypothetical protein n=1 Tax=Acytostelium subglobosum LB1 TaxID=1410327 RepID=UPI0006448C7C|nr:hypothetical protein SAMD00019534_086100 [Acytostelium subglobosum LB1]GAM25435.1 hypothetical protein SAMD00019534_086100 [Acytostelium subglobosum LB1]|eukprot:XP_012751421.1 hypothetical protein SAMD00019534_086100 [Acytostelium subglobosum LB1]
MCKGSVSIRWKKNCTIAPGTLESSIISNPHWRSTAYTISNLSFCVPFDSVVLPGSLPNTITHIRFTGIYSQPIKPGVLPTTLIYLQLGTRYMHELVTGILPASLTTLEVLSEVHVNVQPGALPQSLRSLTLTGFNNDFEPGQLPNSLTMLSLGSYDQPLQPGVLPSTIKTLYMGQFNRKLLPGSLPSSLTKLTLVDGFDHRIEPGTLPQSLTHLSLDGNFNQQLWPNSLPSSLQSLSLSNQFDQLLLPGSLPDSITSLMFGPSFNQPIQPGVLPASLTVLFLDESFNQPLPYGVLPDSLTTLTLQAPSYNEEIHLPPSLKTLYSSWSASTHACPSLSTLYIHGVGGPIDPTTLPQSLLSLYLETRPLLPGSLPASLTHVQIMNIEQPLFPGFLPDTLKEAALYLDQPLTTGVLGSQLTMLTFGGGFNQPLPIGCLPSSLTILDMGYKFDQSLPAGCLPDSLTNLVLDGVWTNTNLVRDVVLPCHINSLRSRAGCIKYLPTSLKSLNIVDSLLSVSAIPNAPPNISLQTVKLLLKDEAILLAAMKAIPNAETYQVGFTHGARWHIRLIDPVKGIAIAVIVNDYNDNKDCFLNYNLFDTSAPSNVSGGVLRCLSIKAHPLQ